VNLSGAEFGAALPGTLGVTYTWPTNAEVDYYMSKGMQTFRIPFMWERLQRTANGPLDATYAAALDSIVAHVTAKGGRVLLNPQNFARYYGHFVGTAAVPSSVFANFWSRVALRYASNTRVVFGLMNEPNGLPTEQWVAAANAAIVAIRGAGATNTITVPGVDWTNAYSWYDSSYGTPNAVGLLAIKDPGNNVVFEVHQYLMFANGAVDQCASSTVGTQRLAPFLKWLRANGKKGIVGEFAGGRNATCYAAIRDMVTTMQASTDVLVGWLWWGGGPWWSSAYAFALDPIANTDRPQMAVLTPFLK
jgi:endoglucanase